MHMSPIDIIEPVHPQYYKYYIHFSSLVVFSSTGVIFDTQQEEDKISFQYAVNQENINNKKFMLIAKNKTIDTSDSYLVEQTGKSN